MPEELHDCVQSVMDDGHDEDSAYAICQAQQKAREDGVADPDALAAVAAKRETGSWPGIHPSEKTAEGREHLLERYSPKVEKMDFGTETTKFKARLSGPSAIFKVSDGDDDRFLIWGKASVEVVDKEGDKITAKALKKALPQLLRRKRLSLEHSDQLVGDIREKIETDDPVTVEIDGKEYTRKEWPTDVLEMEDEEPALYVAGEIWDDTRQAREARKDIEDGVIDSYSISGEAISSSTKVKDGDVFDEITELDLSAVTLCEEGMNQEAKFATVTKTLSLGSDDPIPDKGAASTPVAVIKNTHDMSDSDNDESAEKGEEEVLTREDLRGNFKEAAQEALDEADIVTRSEVEDLVEQSMASKEEEEEEPPSNASEAAGDEAEEEDEEKADEPDDEPDEEYESPDEDEDSEEDTEDFPDETEEKGEEALREAAQEVAEAYPELGVSEEDVVDSLRGIVEGADEDDVVVPEEGDEVPAPDEDAKADTYTVDELQSALPDDLYEAVSTHLEEGGEEEPEIEEPEAEDIEMSEDEGDMDGSTAEKDEDIASVGPDEIGKMEDGEYLEVTASGPVPSTEEDEDLMKSFEREDQEVDGDGAALSEFYNELGEAPTHE